MYTIKQDKTNLEVDVSISNEEWEKGVEEVYQKNKSKFVIAGFRKGHAPRKAIEKEYGDGVFFDDTLENFVGRIIDEVVDSNSEYEPVAQPQLELESYSHTEGTKFKIHMQIVPDFKLPKYTGLSIKTHDYESQLEKSMNDEISHLLRDHSKFVDVDREAKNGDIVVIDFIGFLGNVEFDGGSAENYSLELGSHSFIDNFEDQLVGSKKGDKVDVVVKFPEDYAAKEVAGQDATFKVTVKEVRQRELPEFDDKFVSDTTEFETVEEYKKDLEKKTKETLKNNQEKDFRRSLMKFLGNSTEIDIPDTMIENEANRQGQYYQQIAQLYGLTLEQYVTQVEGSTMEQFHDRMRESGEAQIKNRYILRKIIKEQNITCTHEEVHEKMKEEYYQGMDEFNAHHEAESAVLLDRVYRFLIDNNKQELIDIDDNTVYY